jgi:hypothetical protein
MKKSLVLSAFFLLFFLVMFSAKAQDKLPEKKGSLEISLGFNAFGPNHEMDKIMVDNGFDATTHSGLFGGGSEMEHPNYSKIGFSALLSYSNYFSSCSQWGIMVSYSGFDEIWGATENGDLLGISFSNISLIPLYRCDLAKVLELTAGPAILINFGKRISSPSSSAENYTAIAPGLLCGLNLKIWNRRVTCGKIGSNYLFAAKSKMGPFTTSDYTGEISTIPESKIGFGHLMVYFSFGFHL